MTNQEIALKYLERFCAGDIDGIEPLLAPDLSFTGTLFSYQSNAAYLDSLRADPPEKCGYKVLSITENEDSVALFYEYQKPEQTIQIAQLFKILDQQINEIFIVFDSRGFV